MKSLSNRILKLYQMDVFKRTSMTWIIFQFILWLTFTISYFTHISSWNHSNNPIMSNPDNLLKTFLFIIVNNLILFSIIGLGNIFVRFGLFTLGLIVLIIQGVTIGIIAGTNSFEFPFTSVLAANIQYLKVGLWETTAYAIICGVTLNKSLNISDAFPAKRWIETGKFKDINFNKTEKVFVAIALVSLFIAAYIEAVLITRI